ncbi:MAG: ABC transporter substrate-binding protein [Clostridia bacterium]|nr:ABC transporter substrate-binding protein [Clostridia bacterium]
MKNVFKKVAAAVLAVTTMATAAFALTSCADKTFEKNSFKIGATGPLTGDAASYGNSVKNGAQLAVEEYNKKGGLQLSFAILDDQAGADEAAANYDVLYDAGMQISLGGVTSGSAEAFAKKANVDKVFCMTPSGSADKVIDNMDYSFRLCFGDPDQGTLAAENIVANSAYVKIGALYDTSDPYSDGIYQAFKAKMAELNVTYVEQKFDAENKVDFSTQAEALKDCDVVFMPFYYNEAQLFMKAAVAKGYDGAFFGCDGFDGIADYISDITNKIMYITPFDVNSEEENVKAFVAAYEAKYGEKPDQFAADAYDVVMVIAAALEKAGVKDYKLSAEEVSTAVKNAVISSDFSYNGITGNGMTWTADGKCSKAPKIVEFN